MQRRPHMRAIVEAADGSLTPMMVEATPEGVVAACRRAWAADGALELPPVQTVATFRHDRQELWQHPLGVIARGYCDCEDAARYERARLAALGIEAEPYCVEVRPGLLHDTLYLPELGVHYDPTRTMARYELGWGWDELRRGAARAARRAGRAIARRAREQAMAAIATQLGPLAPVLMPQIERLVPR